MDSHPHSRTLWLWAIVAFVCHNTVNFLYFPLDTIFPDEKRFIQEAIILIDQLEFRTGDRRAWEMPGTALAYSIFYLVSGSKIGIIICARIVQSLLLIFQAFLLSRMTHMIFKLEGAAVLTFLITLFYPFFVFYQGLLLSETLFNTFLVAGFYFLYRWRVTPEDKKLNFLSANLSLAVTIYIKGTLTILPPLLVTVFLLLNSKSVSQTIRYTCVAFCVYLILLSPWWIRNYLVLGDFVPFTTGSAWTFYSGNNSLNQSGGGIEPIDVKHIPEIEQLPELAWSQAYRKRAIDFIIENPQAWVALSWKKFLRFWRLYPYTANWQSSFFKWISILSYGPILLFAFFSVFRHLHQWKMLSPIFMLIAYLTLIHMLMIGSIRYRLPLEPFLIVLAAPELFKLMQWSLYSLKTTK